MDEMLGAIRGAVKKVAAPLNSMYFPPAQCPYSLRWSISPWKVAAVSAIGAQMSVNGSDTPRLPVRKLSISMTGMRPASLPLSIAKK